MKILNFFKLLFILSVLTVGFSSCEDDEMVYDSLIGRTWFGDLGFAVGSLPVESGITFKGNDYAIDEQYYYREDGGGRAATLEVRWWIDGGTLYLDYGRGYPMLELRGIYVDNRYLTGRLYVDGADEGAVTLEMAD